MAIFNSYVSLPEGIYLNVYPDQPRSTLEIWHASDFSPRLSSVTFGALCAGLWILGGPASQTSGETQVAKNWKALVDKQIILLVFSNGGMIHNNEHTIPPIPYVSHQWGNHNPILQKRHKKMSPNGPKYGKISDETLAWSKPYDL
jgi:hypothetical protein